MKLVNMTTIEVFIKPSRGYLYDKVFLFNAHYYVRHLDLVP